MIPPDLLMVFALKVAPSLHEFIAVVALSGLLLVVVTVALSNVLIIMVFVLVVTPGLLMLLVAVLIVLTGLLLQLVFVILYPEVVLEVLPGLLVAKSHKLNTTIN